MKYHIKLKIENCYNAGSKAVEDVNKILEDNGYIPINAHGSCRNRFFRLFETTYNIIKLFVSLEKGCTCFLQWPYYMIEFPLLAYILKRKCENIIVLVHDLDSIRGAVDHKYEQDALEMATTLIVHNESMRNYVESLGIKRDKIKILNTFDYLVKYNERNERHYSYDVAFAGNLNKSVFLRKIDSMSFKTVFYCYGKSNFEISGKIQYKGVFQPEDVSKIEGSWGLVWDGDSVETCSGKEGKYMRLNSPHKVSLYIVAELPIIIWEEAALAHYIKERHLGICISSLYDIDKTIGGVSEEEYDSIRNNLKKEKAELTAGKHLLECLSH